MGAPGPIELVILAVLVAVAVMIFRAIRSAGSQSMKGAPQREVTRPQQRPTEESVAPEKSSDASMRIICDACGAKYQVDGATVSNRSFKFPCQKCGHIVVVRPASPQPVPSAQHTVSAQKDVELAEKIESERAAADRKRDELEANLQADRAELAELEADIQAEQAELSKAISRKVEAELEEFVANYTIGVLEAKMKENQANNDGEYTKAAPASMTAVNDHRDGGQPDAISTTGSSPSARMAVKGGGVFINYRRADSEWPAGALDAKLVAQFGRDRVFKDLDSIGLSENFWLNIEEGIGRSEVMLSLIGPNWFNAENRARLEDPEDLVRREIETAYQKGVLVIPVWLSGAQTPAEADLPASLRPLAKANAQDMGTNRDFDHRVDRLIRLLQAKLEL